MQPTEVTAKNIDTSTIRTFTPAAVLSWFCADRLKHDEAARQLARFLHPEGPHCRKCGVPFTDDRRRAHWDKFERIRCHSCGAFCTAATGTIIYKSEFDQREIILLAVCLELGLTDKVIAGILACTSETVRTWRLKFKTLNRPTGELP